MVYPPHRRDSGPGFGTGLLAGGLLGYGLGGGWGGGWGWGGGGWGGGGWGGGGYFNEENITNTNNITNQTEINNYYGGDGQELPGMTEDVGLFGGGFDGGGGGMDFDIGDFGDF